MMYSPDSGLSSGAGRAEGPGGFDVRPSDRDRPGLAKRPKLYQGRSGVRGALQLEKISQTRCPLPMSLQPCYVKPAGWP